MFARGAWESQAERVAYSIATDRLNLIWVMPAQGRTQHHVEEVFILGVLACAGTPFLLLWHVRERLAFGVRLSRKLIVDAANLAVFKEIFDIART